MLGDIILFFRNWWKKFTCVHEYKHKELGTISFDECCKCGRVKNYFDLR